VLTKLLPNISGINFVATIALLSLLLRQLFNSDSIKYYLELLVKPQLYTF